MIISPKRFTMKPLRAKMLRYMERRGYSEPTVKTYVSWVSQFAQYYGKSPELLSEDDIGAYLDYLKRERQLSQSSLA
ncbi:MAG: phage integrase N-terminal SAM-like domain-containing protein, partial [Bacteroidetes bacterium]|nr:phage integrase N-terminal SAM-like domain-containing protein [Bacteroidota bacterium]